MLSKPLKPKKFDDDQNFELGYNTQADDWNAIDSNETRRKLRTDGVDDKEREDVAENADDERDYQSEASTEEESPPPPVVAQKAKIFDDDWEESGYATRNTEDWSKIDSSAPKRRIRDNDSDEDGDGDRNGANDDASASDDSDSASSSDTAASMSSMEDEADY
jgi:hypothetical protein